MEDGEAELALSEVLGKALVGRVVFRLQVGIVVPVGNTVKTQKKTNLGKGRQKNASNAGLCNLCFYLFLRFPNYFFFASGVFIGGPVSPLLRLYSIFQYSIHFTLEWSPIQVLTIAEVA